jgi:putative membrane protein insertion efficiency factor
MRRPLLWLIRLYQRTLAKAMPEGTCRFHPTCSHYGYEAIEVHGAIKGSAMAMWRVMRCNPWNKGGFDPVPPRKSRNSDKSLQSESEV